MKKIYFLGLVLSLFSTSIFAQYSVDFEDGVKSSYASATVTLNGLDWDMTDALIGNLANDFFNGTQSARLRGYATSSITMLQDKSNGIGNLSFQYRQYGSDAQVAWRAEYSDDAGANWNAIGSPFTATDVVQTFSENVQVNGNVRIRIIQDANAGASNARVNIDDIVLTDFGSIVTVNDTIVSFTTTSATTVEGLETFNVNLKLNQATSNPVSVDVALLSSTNNVLTNTFPETVTFVAGSTTASVAITWLDDATIEANEQFELIIQNPGAGSILGSDSIYTLDINDDDTPLPYYSLATLRGANTDGQADSINVVCKVSGTVLGVNFATGTTQNFFIHDGTAGMGVFISTPQNIFGYTVNEGDSVTMTGTVGQFRGQSQMVNLSELTLVGSGTVPTPTVVTALNESTEGEVVKLENVTVLNQSSWGTNAAGGYDVEVSDGTNNFMVRIDADVNLFGTPIPGCVLDIAGIGSQFSSSTTAPFTSGYRIQPRYTADIVVIDTCETIQPTLTTIADATEVDAQGDPVLLGTTLTLKGIITSPDFRETQNGTEFTFSDGTGGIWAYSSDSSITFDPIVGDSVVVSGNIGAASGVTRLYIDNVSSLGAATPFSPVIINAALGEAQEAELIKIENLQLNGVWNSSGGSYNVSATASGITYDIRVDADRAELFTVPLTTAVTFNLTGVGSQFDSSAPRTEGYQIMPRFASDIEIVNAIQDINLDNFSVSPIPANSLLNISFDYDQSEIASVELVNVLGQVVLVENINLSTGKNKITVSVTNLNSGMYFLKINTSKGVSTSNIMVK